MATVTNVISKMVKNPQKYGARLSLGDVNFKEASEEDIKSLLEFIQNSKHLKKVSFYGMNLQALPSEIFTKVVSAIQYNKNIAGLNFSRSNIDKLDAPILDQVVKLANCQHIKAMYLSYNKFGYCQEHTSKFILDISQASLQTLVMRTGALEGFDEALLQKVADNLSLNKNLKTLNLESAFNCEGFRDAPGVISKLCLSDNIENLDISSIVDVFDDDDDGETWYSVFTSLNKSKSLRSLNVASSGLFILEQTSIYEEWENRFLEIFCDYLRASSLRTIQFTIGDTSGYEQEIATVLNVANEKNITVLGIHKSTQQKLLSNLQSETSNDKGKNMSNYIKLPITTAYQVVAAAVKSQLNIATKNMHMKVKNKLI